MQTGLLAVQVALSSQPRQIPVGISIVTFFQYFGASIFQSIALAVFQNQLVKSLKSHAGLTQDHVQILLDAGTGHARKETLKHFPEKLPLVLWAYNKAITNVFVSFPGFGLRNHQENADVMIYSTLPWQQQSWPSYSRPASNGKISEL